MDRAVIVLVTLAVAGVLGGCGQQPPTSPTQVSTTEPSTTEPSTTEPRVVPDSPAGATTAPAPAGSTPRAINITVRNGQVSGETGRVEVPLGTPVTIFVTSDVADEIHLHGYDREAAIPAGGVGSISFIATIPGVFEVELHESDRQLLQLQVS